MPGGSLTAAQIVSLAMQIAQAPAGYTQQGGQLFTMTMQDLLWKRDLQVNLTLENIPIGTNLNGPFTGAANYLRTYNMTFVLNGQSFKLNPITLDQYDAEFKAPQISSYPYEFAVDSSPQAQQLPIQFFIYPQCNQAITLQHRYFMQQPDIATPETSSAIPWFFDQDYLVHATATRLMTITNDDRYPAFIKIGEEMLRKFLIMEGDKEFLPVSIQLDPRLYRRARSLRPTKVTG